LYGGGHGLQLVNAMVASRMGTTEHFITARDIWLRAAVSKCPWSIHNDCKLYSRLSCQPITG